MDDLQKSTPSYLISSSALLLEQMEVQWGDQIQGIIERLSALMKGREDNIDIELGTVSSEQFAAVICHIFGDFTKKIHKLSELLGRIAVDTETKTVTVIGSNNVLDF